MTQPSPPVPPAEDSRSDAELRAVLARRTGEIRAFAEGFRLAGRTAAVGVPFAIAYGAISGWLTSSVVHWVVGLKETPAATLDLLFQIMAAITAFTTLYAFIQIPKRDRVSRESWVPALFAVPSFLMAAAIYVQKGGATGQMGLVALSFVTMSIGLVWYTFGGAAANIAWMRAAKNELDGKPSGLGEVIGEVRDRTLEVSAVHGAKVTAITVGMQFVLPGIFYALALAFADAIVVLDPQKKAMKRAGQLSTGIRGRLFRMWFLWMLVTFVFSEAIVLGVEGVTTQAEAIQKLGVLFLDPSELSTFGFVVQETVWALSGWVMQLALLVVYLEREDQVRARAEQRRREKIAAVPGKAAP